MRSCWYRATVVAGVATALGVAGLGTPAGAGVPSTAAAARVRVPVVATSTTTGPGQSSPGVRRTPLGSHRPINAPGQRLSLDRVTVAPGARMPRRSPVGTVLVRVERGRARLVVSHGSAIVTGPKGVSRTVVAPAAFTASKGMTVVELPLGVYSGANRSRRPFVVTRVALDALVAPSAVAPEGVVSPPITLRAEIVSTSSVLANADLSLRYGWNHLVGDASDGGETVHCDMLGNVAYVNGAGPFFGFVTYTWPDGSSIVTEMFGESIPQPDGGAVVRAMLTIVGGTGRYRAATGFGSFEGARDATVGAPVRSVFTLTPSS